MIAIIQTGGKQYIVQKGARVRAEKLAAEAGSAVSTRVFLVGNRDGSGITIGTPEVKKGKVETTIIAHGRTRKISMLKYKPKKRYRLRKGHRQHFTEIEIKDITA